jgi:hypothetical protein
MPLTELQAEVLRCVAANRSPDSYLAGATVLHRHGNSPRFSQDVDFFHDIEESVVVNAEADVAALRNAGYTCTWLLRTPAFQRAIVVADGKQLKMEWAQDSAFRFFPVLKDERCGYRLHDADAAVNKLLALAGRQEVRDYVDVLYLDRNYLSLGAMAWGACGKDPGFTPLFLLEHAARHVAYTQADLDQLSLREPLDLKVLKHEWLRALERAKALVSRLPPEDIGCLYLNAEQTPVTPVQDGIAFQALQRHRGCVRGAWPTMLR